jgi:hypothetical protein
MIFYTFLIILFLSSYMLNITSLLYTESFILFLAFFTIFFYIATNTSYQIKYSKEDFKWNETIRFYIVLKNWNRFLIRDRNVKIINYLKLVIQIKKYEILWLRKNIDKLEKRDAIYFKTLALLRLNILRQYRKSTIGSNPINYFSLSI